MSIPDIASEAKRSSFLVATRKLDCFVASLLAMTEDADHSAVAGSTVISGHSAFQRAAFAA